MISRNLAVSRLAPFAFALSLVVVAPNVSRAQEGAPAAAGQQAAMKDVALTAEQRQQYVGTYTLTMPGSNQRTMPFRVYEANGALHGQPEGGQAKRMLYQGDNTFLPEHDASSKVTFTLASGKATGFKVSSQHGVLEAVRSPE